MLPADKDTRIRCFKNALRNWNVEGYIEPKKRVSEWLKIEIPDYSWKEIRRRLHAYVEGGGEIDEQAENRPAYAHYEYHYDLRVPIGSRRIYFETVLLCKDARDADDPVITVVNAHDV